MPKKYNINAPDSSEPIIPITMILIDKIAAKHTTKPLAMIFAHTICAAVTGVTSICSIVLCSRSRMIVAPTNTSPNNVIILLICITPKNHALSLFGLNTIFTLFFTGVIWSRKPCCPRNCVISRLKICVM